LGGALLAGPRASFAGPSATDFAVADALFRDGKALLAAGDYAAACPKLAESHHIDPAGGTVLTLALCYEAAGKTASAWAAFNEARAWARRDGRADRSALAEAHLAALEPRLRRLTLRVPPSTAALPGLEVALDGAPVRPSAFNVALPVDPGPHHVTARAVARRPWSAVTEPFGPGGALAVAVPELAQEGAPVVRKAARDSTAGADRGARGHSLGFVGLGLGVAGVGAGATLGLLAKASHDAATSRCPESPCSDKLGVERNETAKRYALGASVAAGVGLVGLGLAAYDFLLAPRAARPPRAAGGHLGPSFGPAGPQLALRGWW
jgi:hypothetical protein